MVRSVLTQLNRNNVSTDQNFVSFDTGANIVDITKTFRVASYPLVMEAVDISSVTTLMTLNKDQGQSDSRAYIATTGSGSAVSLADKTSAVTSTFSGEQSAAGSSFSTEVVKTVNNEFVEALASDVWVDQVNGTTSGYVYDNDSRTIEAFGTITEVDSFDDGSHTGDWSGDTADFTYDSTTAYGSTAYSLTGTVADDTTGKFITATPTSLTNAIEFGTRIRFRVRFSDNGTGTGTDTYSLGWNLDSSYDAGFRVFMTVSSDSSYERIYLANTGSFGSIITSANENVVFPRDEWLTVIIDNGLSNSSQVKFTMFDSKGVKFFDSLIGHQANTSNEYHLITKGTEPSYGVEYSGSWESQFWIDEIETTTETTPTVQWKCIEYNPDTHIKTVFVRHKDFILPDGVTIYVGSANNPDATSITWQEVTTYIKEYPIDDNAVYLKMEFEDTAGFLNFRSEGLDGMLLTTINY